MDSKRFFDSLTKSTPPKGLSAPLTTLWYDAKGHWDLAHDIAQDIPGKEGALLHAYLHRKEGDEWNAGYWYRSAGAKMPDKTLDEEWSELLKIFLK
ncbi:MAG: hypothetical protein IPL46_09645 [Saprospiraceae bacterium]|nr:hypothetical protein [Saprospiraceae bacterium]